MTRVDEIELTPAEVASLSKEAALIDVDFPYAEDVSRELLGRVLAERAYLLAEVKRLEGERDAALRTIIRICDEEYPSFHVMADCVCHGDNAEECRAIIKAARKMGGE